MCGWKNEQSDKIVCEKKKKLDLIQVHCDFQIGWFYWPSIVDSTVSRKFRLKENGFDSTLCMYGVYVSAKNVNNLKYVKYDSVGRNRFIRDFPIILTSNCKLVWKLWDLFDARTALPAPLHTSSVWLDSTNIKTHYRKSNFHIGNRSNDWTIEQIYQNQQKVWMDGGGDRSVRIVKQPTTTKKSREKHKM